MGHYRSEMVSAEEVKAEAKAEERAMKARTRKIEKAIAEHGVARVLAEIIDDPTMASIRYSGL